MADTQLQQAELFQHGRTLRINGEYDQAVALLERVAKEHPDFAAAHLELGLAYCFTGLFDESIRELETAARLDSLNPEAHLHLAKTYTMLGMYEEGAAAFTKVISLSTPGDKFHDEASKQLAYFR